MLRLALAGLVLMTTALAQEPDVDGPPAAASAKAGSITGVVLTDVGAPAAGAVVTLLSTISISRVSQRSAVSDTSGAFEFQDVSPGVHRLAVSKPGFLQAGGAAIATGRRVTVRPGEPLKGVSLSLARAGVISGRITDELGEPVDQLEVFAMRYGQGMDRRRALMRTGDADLTDDRGEFRVFGLPPGEYVVMAVTTPKAVLNGLGLPAGPYGPFETLPTYFPGTHHLAEARAVVLDAGQEVSAAFTWRFARPFRVSGVIVSAQPLAGPLISLGTPTASTGSPVRAGANGSFVIEGVGPGDYMLSVRNGRDSVTSVPVSVRDADITGLVVTMKPSVMIRGRVTFDGVRRPDLKAVRLVARDAPDLTALMIGDYVEIQSDGRFVVETRASHVFVEAPSGWSVTTLTVDGADAFATGIDLDGRTSIDNVHVRLTDKLTHVTGRVTSEHGEPLDGRVVAVLQLDAGAAPLRIALRTVPTDADGRFEIRGARRGSYVAAALDVAEPPSADDDFLERLRRAGQRFSLQDGQTVTLNLRPSEALR
jgi:hypothetical protein